MSLATEPAGVSRHCALGIDDFTRFEHRYHLAHHFPERDRNPASMQQLVVEGRITEGQPLPGCHFVSSDLDIHQTYETHALDSAPPHLSIIVLLEGQAELKLGEHQCQLGAGQGALIAYAHRQRLSARHAARQRIRAVNITLMAEALGSDARLAPFRALMARRSECRRLSLTPGLMRSLDEWVETAHGSIGDSLMMEGLALQALSQATRQPVTAPHAISTRSRDHEFLERVRHHLEVTPEMPHTLAELAKLACMSQSALRDKYRRHYGRSIFDHLREYRLQLALRLLQEGYKVQEVAFRVGYRHPTNFATAFRQHHGISPSAIR
ncbi:helix-turn-helix transcriptional regulator [Salinicola avicenniae]|uniref:helix-turn-helix transcriptional regulator n=1 Tax=Salinicola avicenniae TaxID=2916836 RepID=UPI0020736143|nr:MULTISPECIES: helix-turn-helix transcriptional regulator [unclassified Salinicola]